MIFLTYSTLLICRRKQQQIVNKILWILLCVYTPIIGTAQCDKGIRLSQFPSKMIEWNLEISKSKDNFLEYELKIELGIIKDYKRSANIEDVLIIEVQGYELDGVGIEKLDENFYAIQMDSDYGDNNHYSTVKSVSIGYKIVYLTVDQKAKSYKFEALGVTRLIPHRFNTNECSCKINYIDSFSIERVVDLAPSIIPLETYGTDSDFKINKFVYPKAEIQCVRKEED